MKDRIRQIMESKHMTQQVFADYIGLSPATVSGIFTGRTNPTLNIVEALKKKIPDINIDWLMFGEGEMYLQPAAPSPATDQVDNFSGNRSQEPILDFSNSDAPTLYPAAPAQSYSHGPRMQAYDNGVRNTRPDSSIDNVKYLDKHARRVTEIRVYYDDQTWESFVPSKK